MFTIVSLSLQGRQSVSNIVRVQSPSLPLPSPLLSSFSPPLLFPSLTSSPLNPARGSGKRSKPPQYDLGPPTILVHFEGEGTLLVHGIKGARFQTIENGFSLYFYEEIFQELTILYSGKRECFLMFIGKFCS